LRSLLVAGLAEELLKFLVFKRLIYDNKEFDEPYCLRAVRIQVEKSQFKD
jgi:RsiW-degrading membrane proteinase PrsW (M82 family)